MPKIGFRSQNRKTFFQKLGKWFLELFLIEQFLQTKGLGLILERLFRRKNVLGLTVYGMHRARIAYKTCRLLNVPYSWSHGAQNAYKPCCLWRVLKMRIQGTQNAYKTCCLLRICRRNPNHFDFMEQTIFFSKATGLKVDPRRIVWFQKNCFDSRKCQTTSSDLHTDHSN